MTFCFSPEKTLEDTSQLKVCSRPAAYYALVEQVVSKISLGQFSFH
jgi:hypothetical protein